MHNIGKKFNLMLGRYWFGMLAAVFAALVCCLLETWLAAGEMPRDSYGYVQFFEAVRSNGLTAARAEYPFAGKFPPLLMLLTVGLSFSGLPMELAGRVVTAGGLALTAAGLFACAWRLFRRRRYALPTALVAISLPQLYQTGVGIMRDPLFWGGLLWLLVAVMRLLDQKNDVAGARQWLRWLFPGGLGGLLLLCRKEAVMVFPLVVLIAVMVTLFMPPRFRAWREALAACAGLFCGAVLVLAVLFVCGIPDNVVSGVVSYWQTRAAVR